MNYKSVYAVTCTQQYTSTTRIKGKGYLGYDCVCIYLV